MPFAAGSGAQDQYKTRCVDDLRCVCRARGDRNVFVDGAGPFCVIIDREHLKLELGDTGTNSSLIEAVWVEADCLPIKRGSILISGCDTYRVADSPSSLHDGWVAAKLKLTCEC